MTRDLFGYEPPLKTWKQEYDEYIRSKEWKIKCQKALERAGNKCEKCGRDKYSVKLVVHHLTYDHFKNEPPEDLLVVCAKNCHFIEDKHREKRTEKRNYERLQEARFQGWVRKVYGEGYVCNDEDALYQEFLDWLESIDEW